MKCTRCVHETVLVLGVKEAVLLGSATGVSLPSGPWSGSLGERGSVRSHGGKWCAGEGQICVDFEELWK